MRNNETRNNLANSPFAMLSMAPALAQSPYYKDDLLGNFFYGVGQMLGPVGCKITLGMAVLVFIGVLAYLFFLKPKQKSKEPPLEKKKGGRLSRKQHVLRQSLVFPRGLSPGSGRFQYFIPLSHEKKSTGCDFRRLLHSEQTDAGRFQRLLCYRACPLLRTKAGINSREARRGMALLMRTA